MKNRHGCTWLDDCRVPYESEGDKESSRYGSQADIRGGNLKTPIGIKDKNVLASPTGRFPANLICSDDVLNDGKNHKSGGNIVDTDKAFWGNTSINTKMNTGDSGSFSRYFDLDKWYNKLIEEVR